MITIYHNPSCSKSREGLAFLEQSGQKFQTVLYLDTPPTIEELDELIKKIGVSPIDIVRTNEPVWKENYKGKKLTDKQIIEVMVLHPRLIERPIVANNNKAVIGRPLENIKAIIEE